MPLFRSSGQPGYSARVANDARHVQARKLEREVQVRFTKDAGSVRTPEGIVRARPGDAIVTGFPGEHWPVPQALFVGKYRPVPPTRAGEDGVYVSLPTRILGVQMKEDFAVVLDDAESTLTGRAGDWLVDYGDGGFGIVSQAMFPTLYEILG